MKTTRLLPLICIVLGMTACMSPLPLGIVKPDSQAKNEYIMTNEFKQLLAENPKPKIVFRIASIPHTVVETEKLNNYVNQMEKLFVQNGFTVRDRMMLEEALKRSAMMDYKAIGRQIDTDLIIDILDLRFDIPNHVNIYFNKATNQKQQFLYSDNYIDCQLAKLECRVTIVSLGQVGGMFTFFLSRCDVQDLDFVVNSTKGFMTWKEHADASFAQNAFFRNLYASIDTQEWQTYFTTQLTYNLINKLMEGTIGQLQKINDLVKDRRHAEALGILENMIKKDPQNPVFHGYKGSILVKQKDFIGAEAELEKALLFAYDKNQKAQIHFVYARLYAQKNESQFALSYLRKALENGLKDMQGFSNDQIRANEDLANIVKLPEFEALLAEFNR